MASSMESSVDNATSADVDRVLAAARDALTDPMVERLASTGGAALEVVNRLSDSETSEAIHAIIDKITEFHRIGALDTLFQTVMLLHAARSASTDAIVERLATFAEQGMTLLDNPDITQCVGDLVSALESASEAVGDNPQKGGLMATLSLLGRPESQQSLYFLLKMGEALSIARSKR